MLIDSHAHLNFQAFKSDLDKVVSCCLAENIWVINVGTKYETSKKAVEIAEKYKEGVYAAVGLHPIHSTPDLIKMKTDPEEGGFAPKGEDFNFLKYKDLAQSPKVVAIGEVGLDYYYSPENKGKVELFKQKQKEILLKQMELAKELGSPVIFHCRKAHNDLISTFQHFNISTISGVIHCFTGKWRQAKEYLDMGFYLGFNGIIFKLNLDEIIKKTPLERILIETDCPYLTPPEFLEKRNSPLAMKLIIQRIAEIKKESFEKIVDITVQNAKNLFGFKNTLSGSVISC